MNDPWEYIETMITIKKVQEQNERGNFRKEQKENISRW